MEIYVSIGAVVISLTALLFSRKDKSNQDNKDDGYKFGQIEEKLANIEKIVAKIENKIDSLDKEVDEKIDKKIREHVEIYHKRGRKSE